MKTSIPSIVLRLLCATAILAVFTSCASSIVSGEFSRLSSASVSPKPELFDVPVLSSLPQERSAEVIAIVTARAYILDKAIVELKRQARLAGADALIEFKQERKVSVDYLQDLYYVEAKAIIFQSKG